METKPALDTTYDEMQSISDAAGFVGAYGPDTFDWWGALAQSEIEAAAKRYDVSVEAINDALAAQIPSARTPRESIDRAAYAVAER